MQQGAFFEKQFFKKRKKKKEKKKKKEDSFSSFHFGFQFDLGENAPGFQKLLHFLSTYLRNF
jgi:hypothetical protein